MTVLWTFLAACLAEALRAWRRQQLATFARRAGINLLLLAFGIAMSVLLFSVSVVQLSAVARAHGVGLLTLLPLPGWLTLGLGVILLDFAEYVLHRLSHQVSWLWRLHAVHHSDRDVDVTTAFRFHPLGVLVTIGWQLAVMVALGIPGEALLLREAISGLWALFQHSSLGKYGHRWQLPLRHLLVMPAVHHYHHSIELTAQSGNFGAVLAVWDRLLGTALPPPAEVSYGLADYPRDGVAAVLKLPFTLEVAAASRKASALGAAQGAAGTKTEQTEREQRNPER